MPNIIKLLPDNIANQIAAGEVIQRPASVVKELLENAIDAKATIIKLITKEAGATLIQVIDNGVGMSEIDARMCFENHATSKLSSSNDLFNLKTMGFRGEALASIAAIAQVELESCDNTNGIGTKIIIEGSRIKNQTNVATSRGTKVSVKNIFFNIPARRNFLKSINIENKHILDEFIRIALSHPHIEFSLHQDEKEIYQLSTGKLSNRIVQIFGENYRNQLIPCEQETQFISIRGYIGKPNHAKKTRGDQFLFVNNRFIKSHQIAYAIKNAYEKLIQPDLFPFYSIYIDIQPNLVDVNVHPNKTEVKFEDESMIYSIINSVVKKSLSIYQVAPAIDFTVEANFNLIKPPQLNSESGTYKEFKYAQFKNSFSSKLDPNTGVYPRRSGGENEKGINSITTAWNNILENAEEDTLHTQSVFHSQMNNEEQDLNKSEKEIGSKMLQIHGKYILFQTKNSVIIVDQCATHKRILFEEYLNSIISNQNKMQNLLFPEHISLSPMDLILIKEYQEDLHRIGFEIESFGKNEILITACPMDVQNANIKQTIESILENLKWNSKNLSIENKENIALAAANSAAMKPGKILEKEEMKSLIERLFTCTNPNYTADGVKTFVSLSMDDIEGLF